MSPEFCLRWNNHRPNFVSVFKELLQSGQLADVTLAAGGEFIQAHRLVLSACSLYFKVRNDQEPVSQNEDIILQK